MFRMGLKYPFIGTRKHIIQNIISLKDNNYYIINYYTHNKYGTNILHYIINYFYNTQKIQ